jgi:hypothetical protein
MLMFQNTTSLSWLLPLTPNVGRQPPFICTIGEAALFGDSMAGDHVERRALLLRLHLSAPFSAGGQQQRDRLSGGGQQHKSSGLYCGPVLRHPAVPIQAANFRPTVAF